MPKTPKDWSWFQKAEIDQAIATCEELLASRVLNGHYPMSVKEGVMCLLLVNLNDLLQKLNSAGARVGFADNINPACQARDVTELISHARNAACHLASGLHIHETNYMRFLMYFGYSPNAFVMNDLRLGCDFADDIAVCYGANQVYVRRHVVRALDAAMAFIRTTDFQG